MANEIYDSTWWGVALDTAPSIGTKPDLFGSQFKMLTSEQDNLVTNGDFATDSDWTKIGQVTISSGSANFVDRGGNTYSFIRQNISQIFGKKYLLKFEIKNYVYGTLQVIFQGGGIANTYNANGVYFIDIESTTTNGYVEFSRNFDAGSFSFSIDNVSVQLVRAEDIEAKKCLADTIHKIGIQDIQN